LPPFWQWLIPGNGLDPNSPDLDSPDLNLLGPILDSERAIIPDPVDIEAVK